MSFLRKMVYLAVFVPAGTRAPDKSIVDKPPMRRSFESWGRTGDCGIIAERGARPVGAAWARLYTREASTYGYVRDGVPVLAVAVLAKYRGRGIGTRILTELIDLVRAGGRPGISLSVDRRNPAFRLYERLGFVEVATPDTPDSNPTLLLTF